MLTEGCAASLPLERRPPLGTSSRARPDPLTHFEMEDEREYRPRQWMNEWGHQSVERDRRVRDCGHAFALHVWQGWGSEPPHRYEPPKRHRYHERRS